MDEKFIENDDLESSFYINEFEQKLRKSNAFTLNQFDPDEDEFNESPLSQSNISN